MQFTREATGEEPASCRLNGMINAQVVAAQSTVHSDISRASQILGSSLYMLLLVCSGSSRDGTGSSGGSVGWQLRPPCNLHFQASPVHSLWSPGIRPPRADGMACLGSCCCPYFSCCGRRAESSHEPNCPSSSWGSSLLQQAPSPGPSRLKLPPVWTEEILS